VSSLEAIYTGATGEVSARFRPSGAPPRYRTARGTVGHYLAEPADTAGAFSLYRWDMGPDSGGPDPHFHRTYAETFFILDGTVRFHDGVDWIDATPGDMLYVPAGGIHGFTNASGAAASMLMLMTPGADRGAYFDELAAIAAAGRQLSSAEWDEVFARHDNVMLG
jgi:mannose-6-phosphate isomerase-like protein (cupin superfamily)